jgi:lipopolysaccharide biosynthesis protein
LHERFITNQQERYAILLPLDSWGQSWDLLADHLVKEAKMKNLDSQQLASCLSKTKVRSENANEGMIDLPIGAYLAKHAKGECWIIVTRWGTIKDDHAKNCSLEHLGAWAMDTVSGYYIAWTTCD